MLNVEIRRGDVVESVHRVRACAVRLDGSVLGEASAGDADWRLFMRSAAKPFQAAASVAAGVLDELGLDDRHLAVACASHNGNAEAVALVREILTAAGLDVFALRTGDDGQGSLIRHQCSGNHALALALCVVAGWSTADYTEHDHPVQRAMNAVVAAACGSEPDLAADNCGMTTHRMTLSAMALAYGRLGVGWDGLVGLDRVVAAMRAHPYLVRQRGEIDSELMAQSTLGPVAKVAAEAGVGVGTSDGVGIAVRIVDGSPRAWGPAVMACVDRWVGERGDHPMLEHHRNTTLLDGAGRPIGSMTAIWSETAAS